MSNRIVFLMLSLAMPLLTLATNVLSLRVVDKDYLLLQFRDGEVHYRDDGTGPSAYQGHAFAEGDDTLVTFGQPLQVEIVKKTDGWTISSADDPIYANGLQPLGISRKAKPMNTDNTLTSKLDHWVYLHLPQSMRQGCTYKVTLPQGLADNQQTLSIRYDVNTCQSEAVHVNIIGYMPQTPVKAADLYLWLGDAGQRDYSSFIGKRVWLLNVQNGKRKQVGKVGFWMSQKEFAHEANGKNMTGSDVWNIDFKCQTPGRYRLVVEDVGCSMDFDISNTVYLEPYKFSVRGYYYMRLGEPIRKDISPAPRQPQFIPEVDPVGFTVYMTDLHPWHPDWPKNQGDIWDEPHFKAPQQSIFWQHRLKGNPTNDKVKGGHSDAFDWDRHLAHVSNIYDLLLPYFLSNGALTEDNLQIAESGNGIPDIIDEARNEVDFFLSCRDGEAYCQGTTNPSWNHSVMFQAGPTTMAAWANAANCAMLAECFRIGGKDSLRDYYKDEAIKAFRFAEKQKELQLDDLQFVGLMAMRGRDFRQQAAAYLYNLTGDTQWEKIMAEESMAQQEGDICTGNKGYQLWATAAYLNCPQERHFPQLYEQMKAVVKRQAMESHVSQMSLRPSRRSTDDRRWQTSQNLQLVMLAHFIATDKTEKAMMEQSMTQEADWALGRNPSNTVEMTGLGERHITDIYTTGRNDGVPETHPGQTPFNGTETWSPGNGGDARILLNQCYPDWNTSGWPHQESFFNCRYMWVSGEFTPRETMRGKMALLGYLYAIRNK